MTSPRGSTWNKWDLHVHSPASFHEGFGLDRDIDSEEAHEDAIWDRYLDELEALDDISCVAITDYFSIEGYKRIRREIEENGRLDNLDLIIPNIELRINNFITSRHDGNGKPIEVHVLFSDDLSPTQIQDEFISQIDATDPDGEDIALTRDSLTELGNIDRFANSVDEDDPYVAGCKLITVKWKDIQKALDRKRLRGKAMTILVKKGNWDNLAWGARSGSERSTLLTQADAVFVQKDSERDWFLGKEDDFTPETFAERFGARVPGIRGSDTHSFKDFCHPAKDRYCWIKADTTWEGLKQIKYEPETRIGIGPESPQRRISIHTPDELSIHDGKINDTLEIAETQLPLNSNLITVIGGKGAGKTALLDLIANCFENQHIPMEDVNADSNSFIERTQKSDRATSVLTRLTFTGDEVKSFEKSMLDDETITRSRIEYLPQGKIAEFCRNDALMHEKVLDLIKESTQSNDPDLLDRFEGTQTEIDKIVGELQQLTNQLHQHNPETIDDRLRDVSRELDTVKGSIADKRKEIEEIREKHASEIHKESVDELESDLEEVEEQLEIANSMRDTLQTQRKLLDSIEKYNNHTRKVSTKANELGLDISISHIDRESHKVELKNIISRVISRIEELKESQDDLQKELDGLQNVSGKLSTLRIDLRQLEDERDSVEDRRKELKETQDKISDLREKRIKQFINYLRRCDRLRDVYSTMISHFQEGKSAILEDVQFRAQLKLADGVQSELFDLLDGRSVNFEDLTPGVNHLEEAIENHERVQHLADDYIEEVLCYSEQLTNGSSQAEYEQRVFGNHIELDERILLDETPMNRLSLGQKGTVLLKILLAEDDKPLIIDQPEENLDNRFIYDTLRDAFRKAKTDRQVIIATHNANLVVNTDAEQVIVARYKDNKIFFESGALENSEIRTHVAEILEGGRDAFIKREQKYDFEV